MKFIKNTINILTWIIIVLLISFIISVLIGIKPYIVLSGSMEPHIHTGSLCFVNTKFDYEKIKMNDIIAFQNSNNKLITHRVISFSGNGIETKGDANDVSDGISTTSENYKGKTLLSIPYLGYICRFLQTKHGMVIGFTIIMMIILSNLLFTELTKKTTFTS